MRTNFFQAIQRLSPTGAWVFNIAFTNENEMVVSVALRHSEDKAGKYPLPPMVYRGSPQEIDEGIFDALIAPVEETKSLFANISAYNKGLADARAKISAKPKAETKSSGKDENAGGEGKGQQPDRPKFEAILTQINALNAACKYTEALKLLPKAEDYPESKSEIKKLAKELEWKSKQLSLL